MQGLRCQNGRIVVQVLKKVLIADDRIHTRNGLRALLSTCSQIEILGEVGDGNEAVRFVEEHAPEVILMDAQMPIMDGIKATREIKARWPEIRIIVLTMYRSYEKAALQAGADSFLVKGCPTEDLLDEILETQE
jgi:DNA-binding NarL/FixJ family response regulator